MISEHGEPGAVLTLQSESDNRKASEKVLAKCYPQMVESLAVAKQREKPAEIAFVLHLGTNGECRMEVIDKHHSKIS